MWKTPGTVLRLNDESSIAFVCNPEIEGIEVQMGVTHAGNPGANSAAGTMQHLALKVKDHDEMMAMRDRLRAKGVPVLGPMDHGMCVSMYFAGPENLSLELSYSSQPINNAQWIDPEVVALAGISKEELERYKNPAAFPGSGGSVAQPAIGETSTGPHMTNYPPGRYEASMSIPDEVFSRRWNRSRRCRPKRPEIPRPAQIHPVTTALGE